MRCPNRHLPKRLLLGISAASVQECSKILNNKDKYDKFAFSQKVDVLRLKGQFLQALGRLDEANENYQKAVQTYTDHLHHHSQQMQQVALQQAVSKTFYHWGKLLDSLFQRSEPKDYAAGEGAVSCYLACLGMRGSIPHVSPHKVCEDLVSAGQL